MMTNADQFESLARECGDALLVVPRHSDGPKGNIMEHVKASARLGSFAATPALEGDIPRTKRGTMSKTRRFIVTHVASGYKVGPTMTEREAVQVVSTLRDVAADTREEIMASREAIVEAFPPKYRPDVIALKSKPFRADFRIVD